MEDITEVGKQLNAPEYVLKWVEKIIERAYELKLHQGRKKSSILAAAFYIAGHLEKTHKLKCITRDKENRDLFIYRLLGEKGKLNRWSRKQIAEYTNISTQTISNNSRNLWENMFTDHHRSIVDFSCKLHYCGLYPSIKDPTQLVCPKCEPENSPPFQIIKM